ncbi:MAG: tryptophan 7-halogenase, partial [Myxococcales bacterium]|nr:tryptophan 7-halogenase [Myxococcales bacterium]
ARERGATVLEEARVTEIIHNDAGRVTGVEFSHDGRVHRVSTRLVIDASGRANFLGRKLGLRMEHEELKGFSVFAHYEGARRVEGDPEGDIRLIFDQDMWFWWAPLKSPKTSVGVVANRERYWEEYAADPEGFYERHLQRCDYIRERVADAQRITEIRPVSANGSSYAGYHYTCAELLGDGWALVGDAAGFVDPIFSAGLFVTQTAAWWLAEALLELDADAWPTRAQLQPYADRCKREFAEALDHIKRFATYYFDPRFVDFFLSLGSRKPELRKLYIDTFIAYEPKAIIEFGRLMERMQRMSRHAPAVEVSRSL